MADIFERLIKNYGPIGEHRQRSHGYYTFPKLEGDIDNRMQFRGKEVVVWSLNNYLGLANHPEIRKADTEATANFGLAYPMGARMMSGNSIYHEQLEKELAELHKEMIDRFGPVPPQVEDLFTTVRCRKIAVELGFEKMILKNETLKCFFVANPDSPYFTSKTFEKILDFIQTKTNKAKLKQVGKNGILIVQDIRSMKGIFRLLQQMEQNVVEEVHS